MNNVADRRMVTLVREAKGWSQRDLADESRINQATISKVENGLLELKGDKLEAVATALDCPVALLTSDVPMRGLEVTCLHHRRRSSQMTAGVKKKIEAITHLTRISVEGLLKGIELLPDAALERLDIDEYENDPAEIARLLRVRWRLPSGPIPSVLDVLEAVGVVVVMRQLGTTAQDAVSSWPYDVDRPPMMLVNTGLSTDRQRFTTAHELGHLVMHRIPNEMQEAQANAFASSFLAPAEDIHPDLAGLTTRDFPRLLELKSKWGMSVAALIRRASDLEIISERQYREFNIKLGRLGWRTLEPGNLPPEEPHTIRRVLEVHLTDDGYSVADLAKVAVMTEPAFRRHFTPPVAHVTHARTPLRLVTES